MFESLFGSKAGNTISQSEARQRLASGNAILLDVRTPEEYRQIRIPNSIPLPLNQVKSGIGKVTKDKNAEIIVYCLSGMRAGQAARELATLGYTNVKNMGGIQSWRYETERG